MAGRKEEKERLRREREAAEKQSSSSERKRLLAGYALAGLISVAVLAGIVFAVLSGGDGTEEDANREGFGTAGVVFDGAEFDQRAGTEPSELATADLDTAATEGGCALQRDLKSDGNSHSSNEDKEGDWSTNPPASGDHYGVPNEITSGAEAAGPYANTPPMGRVVHSLEHGRVAIQYSPDLPEEQQLVLKGIFDERPLGVLLFPNPELDDPIAVTAWTQLMTCEGVTDKASVDAIRNFRDEFLGRGPEAIPFEIPQ